LQIATRLQLNIAFEFVAILIKIKEVVLIMKVLNPHCYLQLSNVEQECKALKILFERAKTHNVDVTARP